MAKSLESRTLTTTYIIYIVYKNIELYNNIYTIYTIYINILACFLVFCFFPLSQNCRGVKTGEFVNLENLRFWFLLLIRKHKSMLINHLTGDKESRSVGTT